MTFLLLCLLVVSSMTSMAGMAIVGGSYLIISIARRAMGGNPEPFLQIGYLRATGILFGAVALSLLSAKYFPIKLCQPSPGFSFFSELRKFWYFLIPIFVASDFRQLSVQQKSRFFEVWVLAAALLSIVGIQQFWTGWPRPQPIPFFSSLRFHATLFFGHHLSTASILIFPFFISLFNALERRGMNGVYWKTACALILSCLFFTYSRTLWIGLAIVIPIAIVFWNKRRPTRWTVLRTSLIAAIVIGVILSMPGVSGRVMNLQFGNEVRNYLWQIAWELWKKSPVVGVGFQQFHPLSGIYQICTGGGVWFTGHAHQLWIEALVSTGLVGLGALVGWQVWLTRVSWKAAKDRSIFHRAFFAAWVAFLVNGLTQVNLWEGKVLFQLMIALGVLLSARRSQYP